MAVKLDKWIDGTTDERVDGGIALQYNDVLAGENILNMAETI